MPALDDQPSAAVVKLLNIGESGTGKTGSLASLAAAGYNLYILDYDNNAGILRSILADDAPARARIQIETLRDKINFTGGVPKVEPNPQAYASAGKVLTSWEVDKLTPKDVIILDTLSSFSEAAFNQALKVGGRLNQRPQLQDYGWMADSVKLFIELLTSPEINCNVVVNTHIRFFAGDEDTSTSSRGLPNAKGQQISTVVSRYFGTVVHSKTQGTGPAAKRIISTQPQGVVEVKTSAPKAVKATYPVDGGLAQLFADILGKSPTVETKGT